MASTSNIYTILRLYANKQNMASINFNEFSEYVKRYAQHYLSENPDLKPYLENTAELLKKELAPYEEAKKIIIKVDSSEKEVILITSFYLDKLTTRYKEIHTNVAIPFPQSSDMGKNFPTDLAIIEDAADVLYKLLEKYDSNGPDYVEDVNPEEVTLFSLNFKKNVPSIMMPSSISMQKLLEIAIMKIRSVINKSEHYDYFLKKMIVANSGKEISCKNFFTHFAAKPIESIETLKQAGDIYYFWNQFMVFIRQDYEKIKEPTAEDISMLQAISIIEITAAYYKNKSQKNLQRSTALKNLELAFSKPPYYFNIDAITRFVDSRGVPLLGQFSNNDLEEYLKLETQEANENELPKLLVFKAEDGQHYYILKEKVMGVVVKLCDDIRAEIKENLTKEFCEILQQFDHRPFMKDQRAFEKKLEEEIQVASPVLYALLTSSILSALHYETAIAKNEEGDNFKIFANGKLLPYSELLAISKDQILTDAKILIPFWYSIPIISFIFSLFRRKPKKNGKKKKDRKQKAMESAVKTLGDMASSEKKVEKVKINAKDDLKKAVYSVEKQLIPEGSNLEAEMRAAISEWNHMLDRKAKANLTEDVNSLIRDYMRKVVKTLKGTTFDIERIENLSKTLLETQSLMAIRDQENLERYIQLYIIQILKDI